MLPSRIFIAGGDTRNTRESSQVTAPAVPDRTRRRTAVADGPSSSTKSGSGVPRDSAQACATMYLGINRWAANASACHSMGGFLGISLCKPQTARTSHRTANPGRHWRGRDGGAAASGRPRGRR